MRFSNFTVLLIGAVSAVPIKSIKRQEVQDEYDFIICGTAGLVLADKLSESGTQKVLVIEAGPVPSIVENYATPGGNQFLGGTAIQWGYYTVPQQHLNNRILYYGRGKALGGSSVTNGLFYGRGSASVYDKWVNLGNPGWEWYDLYPFAVKHTHFNPPDFSNGWDHSYQSWDANAYSDGPLQIGFQGYVPPSNVGFIKACEAINIPIVAELNNGNNTGVKQGTGSLTSQLRRSSSYDSFYQEAKNRSNLDVLHWASVTSLTLNGTDSGTPHVTGVVFIDQPTGLLHTINARKEVVLALGAFASPQLLMVSGIGPQQQLAELGISPVYVNENVGQNMNDHSVFSVYATVQPSASTSSMSANASTLEAAQADYYNYLKGDYTAPSGITNGFQQMTNAELEAIGAQEVIKAGLTNQSQVEFLYESVYYPSGPTPIFINGSATQPPTTYYQPASNESYISLTASALVALSRGNIKLRTSSMSDAPMIDPNYYANPSDRYVAINAFKDLRKLLAHPALAQFAAGPDNGEVCPGLDKVAENANDNTIFEYIKANTIPNWHASGTCQMLPEKDGGVVDPTLKVYGVSGLRVVDVSIIPRLPDVNLQGPVYMIAEKGASMIRGEWGF